MKRTTSFMNENGIPLEKKGHKKVFFYLKSDINAFIIHNVQLINSTLSKTYMILLKLVDNTLK